MYFFGALRFQIFYDHALNHTYEYIDSDSKDCETEIHSDWFKTFVRESKKVKLFL
jgi:hypothetical protein